MELWLIGYMFTLGAIIASGELEKARWYSAIFTILLMLAVWPAFWGGIVHDNLNE